MRATAAVGDQRDPVPGDDVGCGCSKCSRPLARRPCALLKMRCASRIAASARASSAAWPYAYSSSPSLPPPPRRSALCERGGEGESGGHDSAPEREGERERETERERERERGSVCVCEWGRNGERVHACICALTQRKIHMLRHKRACGTRRAPSQQRQHHAQRKLTSSAPRRTTRAPRCRRRWRRRQSNLRLATKCRRRRVRKDRAVGLASCRGALGAPARRGGRRDAGPHQRTATR